MKVFLTANQIANEEEKCGNSIINAIKSLVADEKYTFATHVSLYFENKLLAIFSYLPENEFLDYEYISNHCEWKSVSNGVEYCYTKLPESYVCKINGNLYYVTW